MEMQNEAEDNDAEEVKSNYSPVHSDIYSEKEQKLVHKITEQFALLFVLFLHNGNLKDLGDDDEEEED